MTKRAFWEGHPPGLIICFLTEMWERFSYYGMRALLIFYLTQHFLFSDNTAFMIYAAYSAMVYMLPVIGGALADQYLGYRKAVSFGAILLVLGHFGLAIEGPQVMASVAADGSQIAEQDPVYIHIFFLSLALIATGVGFLKTNISAIVGALYEAGDTRRDSGFTIFYLGINIGGAIAPILCGWLGQTYGWHIGFGLAGIGMLGGLIVFQRGQKYLQGVAEPPQPDRLQARVLPFVTLETSVYLAGLLVVAAAWVILMNRDFVGPILSGCGIIVSLGIAFIAIKHCTPSERNKLCAAGVLLLFLLLFLALYEQMGSSMNIFADRVLDRSLFGYEIPASTLQSLPAIFVIVLAPLFSMAWTWLGARGLEPTTPIKFALGIVGVAFSLLSLVLGTLLAGEGLGAGDGMGSGLGDGRVNILWFFLAFFWLVVGELLILPVGLSMISRLSPRKMLGLMMGAFFLSYSVGSFIAGLIAQLTTAPSTGAGTDTTAVKTQFLDIYLQLGLLAIAGALVLYLISPLITHIMHDEGTGNRGHIAKLYSKRFQNLNID